MLVFEGVILPYSPGTVNGGGTLDPFKRHKIEHLSPSSLNTYVEQPSFWFLKYLMGMREPGNPAMWRGSAVEAGLDSWVYKYDENEALAAMHARFEEDAQGEIEDKIDKERDVLGLFLQQACRACGERGISDMPTARQLKIEYWFDGIEVPVIGYVDYEWPEFGLDLKTTHRIPSDIPGRHARQISLYSMARQKPYRLLYVSTKRADVRELSSDEVRNHIKHLEWNAHTIRRALALYEDPTDLVRLFPPNFDHYMWKDETIRQKATEILDVQQASVEPHEDPPGSQSAPQ